MVEHFFVSSLVILAASVFLDIVRKMQTGKAYPGNCHQLGYKAPNMVKQTVSPRWRRNDMPPPMAISVLSGE